MWVIHAESFFGADESSGVDGVRVKRGKRA
jgi:hypothetical protein